VAARSADRVAAVVLAAVLAIAVGGCAGVAGSASGTPAATAASAGATAAAVPGTAAAAPGTAAGTTATAESGQPAVDPASGLAVVGVRDLPAEASATIARIGAAGPYPYAQDGAVFQNREGLLPPRPAGWYREYTVTTPGSTDRGARRIVAGEDGTLYWTDDHYQSFRVIRP
jgi:ribonuclease T1